MPIIDRTILAMLDAMLEARTSRLEIQATEIETAALRGEIRMLRVVMGELDEIENKVRQDG